MTDHIHNHPDDGVVVEVNWTERWLLPLLCVGVLLDLLISAILVPLALETHAAANKAEHANSAARISQEAQYQGCLAANEARRESLQLWESNHELWVAILAFFNDPRASAFKDAIQAHVDQQEALARKTFALHNCEPLNPAAPPTSAPATTRKGAPP